MATTAAVAVATRSGHAMGTIAHVEVHGAPELADLGFVRIARLERLWSRFLANSEISRLNAARGVPVFVSADTRRLVRHGIAAWERTGGSCDPTVLDAIIAAGYDRPFDRVDPDSPVRRSTSPAPTPGCAGIEIDDDHGWVVVPPDTGFDPGAIGKGLAADIVAAELRELGATGVYVDIGGDIRTAGTPGDGDGWLIDIVEPTVADRSLGRIALAQGAVATSTDRRRRWGGADRPIHHVIDPATGRPATTRAAMVTTVAARAWWAEALATWLMLLPPDEREDAVGDDGALVVEHDGTVEVLGSMGRHLR